MASMWQHSHDKSDSRLGRIDACPYDDHAEHESSSVLQSVGSIYGL